MNDCFTRSGSNISFRIASLLMRATRCEKRHVEIDSCKRFKKTYFKWLFTCKLFYMTMFVRNDILPRGCHYQLQLWQSLSSYNYLLGYLSAQMSIGSSCMECGDGLCLIMLWWPEGKNINNSRDAITNLLAYYFHKMWRNNFNPSDKFQKKKKCINHLRLID